LVIGLIMTISNQELINNKKARLTKHKI